MNTISYPPSRSSRGRFAAAFGLLLALGLAGLAGAVSRPGSAVPDPSAPGLSDTERLHAVLDRVAEEQKGLRGLSARFTMTQENELLLEAEQSRGVLSYAAPDKVRWEYLEPRPMTVLVTGETMTTWYRDLGRAERAKIGKVSDRVMRYMNAATSLANLLEYFSATVRFGAGTEPYRIELEPRYQRIARRLSSLTLWIDRERYLPVALRIEGADGSVTDIRFESVEVDPIFPADRFVLVLPEGVEVREVELGQGER